MWKLLFSTLLCVAVAVSEDARSLKTSTPNWDILIFTQSWPNTVCLQWKEKYENHTCLIPTVKDEWTIHGIWPTIYGTHKPGYCNTTWKFDENKIAPIKYELDKYWPNIQNGSSETSLWEHEWEKHGTCAASLPVLGNEYKYFKQGLSWRMKYNLANMLSQGGIKPSNEKYAVQDVVDAVKKLTNKNPAVECMRESATGEDYLLEIRICFDKELKLIDCDGIKPLDQSLLTNCPQSEGLIYPLTAEPVMPVSDSTFREENVGRKPKESGLLTLLKVITYLQWFTL